MAEATEQETSAGGTKWPVAPFKSITNLAQKFSDEDSIPPKIDRSVLGGSEGQKTVMISTLRTLGWINDANVVQPVFSRFVKEEKERGKILKETLSRLYPDAAKLAQNNATPAQYGEMFAPYQGETLRKAMTFFFHAARYATFPLSKNFKVQRASRAARKSRPSNGGGNGESMTPPPVIQQQPAQDAKSRYLDMLLEKAKTDDKLDPDLLNRIERLLGVPNE